MFGLQMIHEMDNLQREMDQIFRGLGFEPAFTAQRTGSLLKLHDAGDAYQVKATLPGIDIDKLDISVLGRQLKLSGDFISTAGSDEVRWHRRERGSGHFEHAMQLPASVDTDKVEAEYRQGILSIMLPKAASALPKKISVKAG
jgi:HSP20 family protein